MRLTLLFALAVSFVLGGSARSTEGVQVLHPFPYAVPTQMVRGADGNFYGYLYYDASNAAADAAGTGAPALNRVFQLTPAGEYKVIHYFGPYSGPVGQPGPDDGPSGPLVAGPDGSLYGAVAFGGANGYGAMFRLTPDGTYEDVFDNTADQSIAPFAITPSGDIYGSSVLRDGTEADYLCQLSAQGDFSILYTLASATIDALDNDFIDAASAAQPRLAAHLLLASDGTIYGATERGGEVWHQGARPHSAREFREGVSEQWYGSSGTLFSLKPDGTFTILQDGAFFGLTEGANGTIYGWGAPTAGIAPGVGNQNEIFSYTPAEGYRTVRAFDQLTTGDLGAWMLGADGNSYAAVEFPEAPNPYGAFGGINLAALEPSGKQTVLESFPCTPIADTGAQISTAIWQILDGHDGYVYVISSTLIPVMSDGTPVTGGAAARASQVRYIRRAHVARVRATSSPHDRLATVTDRVDLPRARAGVPTALTINALRNDLVSPGAKPAIVALSTPQHGTVEIVPATAKVPSLIRYTATDLALQDTFTYRVSDASGAAAIGQVVVYGPGRGLFRGAVTSAAGATRLGSASLRVGSAGAFSGAIVIGKETIRIVGARFDANNVWSHVFYQPGRALAEVSLRRRSDGAIEGVVAGPTVTGQFTALHVR